MASGVCVRLYDEDDYLARPEFTDPEILRSSLAAVILRMKSLKIGEVESFPFLQPPQQRMISDGYQLLAELGAVDDDKRMTRIGWRLAKFPIDPRIARMILAANDENCLTEILIIASALSLQDPRDRPFDKQDAADRAHAVFQDERSDFMAFLKLWTFFNGLLKHKKSNKKLAIQCHEHFISHRRMREWREIHSQLHGLVKDLGLRSNQIAASYEEIHRALLAGLLGNIGFKANNDNEYLGARGIKFSVFPGSVLKKGKAKWIVGAALVETTKLYGRCVAKIDPSWLEKIAKGLCKKHYFDPHWEKKSAQVTAYERVTLYGLTIVPKRRINFGAIKPKEARVVFIRHALVAGEFSTRASFFSHNRQLIQEIEALEHKARRQDVLVDDEEIYQFFDALIPEKVCNGAGFEKWRKQAETKKPQLLYLTREYLMRHAAGGITEEQFPENMRLIDGNEVTLSYRFEPGHTLDGVTVTIPLPQLNRLQSAHFDHLVPGLVREKITWYFKALPKQIRRNLVPLPDAVTQFLSCLEANDHFVKLTDLLAKYIHRKTGNALPIDTWEHKVLPVHLLMNYKVVDDAGQELAMNRDLMQLQTQLGQAAQITFAQPDTDDESNIEQDNVMRWDFGDLPKEITFTRMGKQFIGYPALIDQDKNVAIRLIDTPDVAEAHMREGVRRLIRLELKDRMKQLEKNLPGLRQIALQLTTLITPEVLKQDMLTTITDRASIGDDELPRNEQEFTEQKKRARTRLPAVTEALSRVLQHIGDEYLNFKMVLSDSKVGNTRLRNELDLQLNNLIYPGFLVNTPWERLQHLPRYLKGMTMRLQKFANNPQRDGQHSGSLTTCWNQYCQRLEKHQERGLNDSNLTEFRWQIEELRISLFAQELKTPMPVSIKRLEKLWEKVLQ